MEEYKKELIDAIYNESRSPGTVFNCCDVDTIHSYAHYHSFMDKMTFDEIVTFVNSKFKDRLSQLRSVNEALAFVKIINGLVREFRNEAKFETLRKEVANVGNTLQNTADVVNLFTDIEKNRTNTDNRIDKLEQKIDNLESSINQILNLLQKS